MQALANPPKIAAFKFSSTCFGRIVGVMFMRVNVRCAHQARPPRRGGVGGLSEFRLAGPPSRRLQRGRPPMFTIRAASDAPGEFRQWSDTTAPSDRTGRSCRICITALDRTGHIRVKRTLAVEFI